MGTYIDLDETAVRQIAEALGVYTEPNMTKVLRKAAAAGANAYRAPLRAAAPVKSGGSSALRGGGDIGTGKTSGFYGRAGDYGEPGDLRDSIKQRRVRADGYGISAVVGPMGKKAFTRRWVTKGTKGHPITARAQAARAGLSFMAAASNVAHGRRHTLRLPGGAFRDSVRHPGAKANPFIAQVGAANRERSKAAMVRAVTRAAKKFGGHP